MTEFNKVLVTKHSRYITRIDAIYIFKQSDILNFISRKCSCNNILKQPIK